MTVAVGSRTTGDLVTLVTDARWETYAGTAPPSAVAPFVVVDLSAPVVAAQSGCFEDQGAIRPRWLIKAFAASVDQVRWLQGQILALNWPDMILEQITGNTLDQTEQPDLYMAVIVFRDYRTVDL